MPHNHQPTDWLHLTIGKKDEDRFVPAFSLHHVISQGGFCSQIKTELTEVLLRSKMNLLLLLLPPAIIAHALQWPAGAVFVLSLLPLCSLAERLGMITEQLALYTNDTLGGLLNATFGNATEVIIAAFAIKKGFLRVVKLTLLGSIISNLLLVMGSAFVAGGVVHSQQTFNKHGINVNCGLLILSVVAIMLPTLLSSTAESVTDFSAEVALSRFESVLMLLAYGLFLVFQLVTHRHLYESADEDQPSASSTSAAAAGSGSSSGWPPPSGAAQNGTSCFVDEEDPPPAAEFGAVLPQSFVPGQPLGPQVEVELAVNGCRGGGSGLKHSSSGGQRASSAGKAGGGAESLATPAAGAVVLGEADVADLDGEEVLLVGTRSSVKVLQGDEDEEKVLSWPGCFIWLTVITVLISILSDYIMDAITEASRQLKVPMPFLTCIIVPIVGNAAEHASALLFAVRNRMEISLGVAMGSSTQVGVLVVPFCVVLAWCLGQPLDLNFNEFEALVLFISVLLAIVVVQDGTSNWLKGAMLILTYMFVAAGFWVHKDPTLSSSVEGSGR